MKKIAILALVSIISCSKTDSENSVFFKDSVSFEHINFSKNSAVLNENFNSLVARINKNDDTFSLYVVDVNKNGKFNDGEDAIMINPYNSTVPQNVVFNNKIKNENYFSINNNVFKISKIKNNNSMYEAIFEWDSKVSVDKVNLENRMIDRLPDLEYSNFENKKIRLSSFLNNNRYIYVEFWALWCSPCLSFIPEIKNLNEKYADTLEIVSIASDRQFDQKATYSYIKNQEMSWNQGFSNKKIDNELSFNFLPRGYLFNSKGRLIIYDASPKTVALYLEKLRE